MQPPDDGFRVSLNRAVGMLVARHRLEGGPSTSQSELAEKVGISRAAISALESGAQGVSLTTLCKIAHSLGVAPAALLPSKDEIAVMLTGSGAGVAEEVEGLVEDFLKEGGYGYSESEESGETPPG